jgi:uncharacterized membrane protein HdeD (DUF308 family)
LIYDYVNSWRWLAVRSAAAVIFGIATLAWPGITLWALVVLWGAYVLVDGAFALVAAITTPAIPHRGWMAFTGVAGIAAGLVTFIWPSITAVALTWVIAFWALVVGVTLIAAAIRVRKVVAGEWRMIVGGVLLIAFGFIAALAPADGALGITWAIGWFAVFYGVMEMALALRVHEETKGLRAAKGMSGTQTPRPI